MSNYGYLDPSSPNDGNDIDSGYIREQTSPHRTTNAVKFLVRVLTKPIPVDAADVRIVMEEGWITPPGAPSEGGFFSSDSTSEDADGVLKIMFRGRIIRSTNGLRPHVFLRDPCRISMTRDIQYLYRLLSKYTLFMSKTAYYGNTPSIGDIVQVTLQRSDFRGPDLQTAYFDEIVDKSQSELYRYSRFQGSCQSLVFAMEQGGFDPDEYRDDLGTAQHERSRTLRDTNDDSNENFFTTTVLDEAYYFNATTGMPDARPRDGGIDTTPCADYFMSYEPEEEVTYNNADIITGPEPSIKHFGPGHGEFDRMIQHIRDEGYGDEYDSLIEESDNFFTLGTYDSSKRPDEWLPNLAIGRDSRRLNRSACTTIVFHHTAASSNSGGDGGRNSERITHQREGQSYHFTIYKDGSIAQYLPIDFRCIGSNSANSRSIAISFENLGNQHELAESYGNETNVANWDGANADGTYDTSSGLNIRGTVGPWDPYTPRQKLAALKLVAFLKIFRPAITSLIPHRDPAIPEADDKQDTGPNFDLGMYKKLVTYQRPAVHTLGRFYSQCYHVNVSHGGALRDQME